MCNLLRLSFLTWLRLNCVFELLVGCCTRATVFPLRLRATVYAGFRHHTPFHSPGTEPGMCPGALRHAGGPCANERRERPVLSLPRAEGL